MIPVLVVTGFLGAGKTTLLRRLLRDPAWADSAVVVNEFGEVPLDHELVEASEDTLVSLSTGCLCCAVRGDLARSAGGEVERRAVAEERADRGEPVDHRRGARADTDGVGVDDALGDGRLGPAGEVAGAAAPAGARSVPRCH